MAETSPTKHTPLSNLPTYLPQKIRAAYHTIPIPFHSSTNGHQPARHHFPRLSSLTAPHVSNPSSAPDTQTDPSTT